jgi:homoserine O-acetyltransferase
VARHTPAFGGSSLTPLTGDNPVPIGPAGSRTLQVQKVDRLELDSGTTLRDVRQAYHLDGTIDAARDNVVLVLHALTGSADAVGDWWRDVAGPGRPVDTGRWAVVSPNLLGSRYGTTGPSSGGKRRWPDITTRDQARLAWALLDELGVERPALVVGGSLGGMVALEVAASRPAAPRATVALAAPAAHTAWAIGWNHAQRAALDALPDDEGLRLARRIAMVSYRSEAEFEQRFGRAVSDDGRFAAQRWLDGHADRLAARFDARTYRALIDAMDAHDVGRGRGGITAALRAVTGRLVGVGIPTDALYGEEVVRAWARDAEAEYRRLDSVYGHDGFLIEQAAVGRLLAQVLDEVTVQPSPERVA